MKLKQNNLKQVKLFSIDFISMCGQFKPLVKLMFSLVCFIFNDMPTRLVRYCFVNFVTRALRVAYRDKGKDCERKTQKSK